MLSFFHEHMFYKYNGDFYTSGSLTQNVLNRYLKIFESITLITRCKDIYKEPDLKSSSGENTKFVCVPNHKSLKRIHHYFKARKIIKDEVLKAQYIILRSGSFANIAAKYARKFKKPYLVEVVGCSWDGLWNYNIIGKLLAPFSFIAQKRTVKHADYALYVTSRFLQKRYPTNGKATNCSNVELEEFNDGTLEKRLNKIENQNHQNIVIGTAAAVDVKYKGQQHIIKALGKLKEKGLNNFEYQIVGNGDPTFLKSVARKFNVSEKVKFMGGLTHQEVFNWLDTIDIYTQPSQQEGLPRALIEAMSKGLPVFGANTGGIPELLEDDFIFKNNSNKINQICSVLLKFTKDIMLKQAKRNFNEAKYYEKERIEKRRQAFFKDFKSLTNAILYR